MARLGFRSHSLDVMFFFFIDADGRLQCLVLIYVDVFLIVWLASYDIGQLRDAFVWVDEWVH